MRHNNFYGERQLRIDHLLPKPIRAKMAQMMREKGAEKRAAEFLKDFKFLQDVARREDDDQLFTMFKLGGNALSKPPPELFSPNAIVNRVNQGDAFGFEEALREFLSVYSNGMIGNSFGHSYQETDKFNFIIEKSFSDSIYPHYNTQQFVEETIDSLVYRRGGVVAQLLPIDSPDEEGRHAKILTYANADKKSGKKMMIDFIELIQSLFLKFDSVFGKVADEESEVQMVYGGNPNRFNRTTDGRSKLARFYQSIGGQLRRFSEKEEIYFFKDHRLAFELFDDNAFENFTKSTLNIYEYNNKKGAKSPVLRRSKPRPVEKISEEK